MRVLHVIESLGRGGAEQALVNLFPALIAEGNEIEVAVLWGPYDLQEELQAKGVYVHRFNFQKRRKFLSSASVLNEFVEERKYDVVHAHLLFSGLYVWLSRIGGITRRCITFHNLAYAKGCNPNNLKFLLVKQLNKLAMRYGIDGHVAVSTAVASHYKYHLGLSSITVIPNAFPHTEIYKNIQIDKKATRAKYGIGEENFLIIMPGRLVREKGHDIFISALEQLLPLKQSIRAMMIGSGPLEGNIKSLIVEAGLSDKVILHDAMSHHELLQLVSAADLLVTPSIFEGFGLAAGEAMSMGTPVIATTVGGLVDLIEDEVSGVLIPPDDPISLAKAINRLMGDPGFADQLSVAGKARIAAFFDVPIVANRMNQFYQALLENGK